MTRAIWIGLLFLACGAANQEREGKPTGKTLYRTNCTLCHGADGKLGLNGALDLSRSTLSREEMIAVVRNGRGAMMPYQAILGQKEIEAVVDHVRTLRQE